MTQDSHEQVRFGDCVHRLAQLAAEI